MCTASGEENKTLLLKTKAKTNIYVADTLYIYYLVDFVFLLYDGHWITTTLRSHNIDLGI